MTTGPTPGPPSGWVPPSDAPYAYPAPAETRPPEPPHGDGGLKAGLIVAGVAIAIIAGFLGGVVSHAAFPAKQGPQGVHGPTGPVGSAGPAGPAGTAGNVNTSNLGYCISTSTETLNNYTPPVFVVTGVSIYAPTITNGTQSCPTGSFESLSPTP
jgi:hypothetical protein